MAAVHVEHLLFFSPFAIPPHLPSCSPQSPSQRQQVQAASVMPHVCSCAGGPGFAILATEGMGMRTRPGGTGSSSPNPTAAPSLWFVGCGVNAGIPFAESSVTVPIDCDIPTIDMEATENPHAKGVFAKAT